MFRFQLRYCIIAVLLFITEVLIATYVHDGFVRPYAGDFLVVILLYCFIKSFLNAPVWKVALGVLLFSFCIESLQYIHFISLLGWDNNKLARVVLGTSFSVFDLLAYTLGIAVVMAVEKWVEKK